MDSNKSIGATFSPDTSDSDGDGFSNYDEIITYSTDPNDSSSFPNEAPVITNQTFSIAENSANSTEAGTISATDSDGDSLTYTIQTNIDPNSDGNKAFSLSGSKLITNDADDLDYENTSSLEIFVKVSDGIYSTVGKMTINLTDDRTEDADGDRLTEAQEEDT